MRMFTKMGLTAASAALPVLLWAGAASAQSQSQSGSQRCQSASQQSQSPECFTSSTGFTTLPTTTNTGGGALARTGNEGMLPLAVGGAALAGAVVVRRGLRRRSAA